MSAYVIYGLDTASSLGEETIDLAASAPGKYGERDALDVYEEPDVFDAPRTRRGPTVTAATATVAIAVRATP